MILYMNIPRRTIKEIQARFQLHPTIQEIYVEGLFDKDIYNWVLKNFKKTNVKVYPISTVEVKNELLEKYGYTSGERQRVIVFSKEMLEFKKYENQIFCIIDADYDHVLKIDYECEILRITDGTSTELLFLNTLFLEKFFEQALGSDSPKDEVIDLVEKLQPIAIKVFLIRAVIEDLKLGWSIIDIQNEINKKVIFNFEDYLEKVFNKNAANAETRGIFKEKIRLLEETIAELAIDKKIHGHDFITAFCKILLNNGTKKQFLREPLEVGRLFFAALEWDFVKDSALFNEVGAFSS